MKAYIQLLNNYIVKVQMENEELENLIEIELPEDFDYGHINWYEYVDGELIYHDRSDEYPVVPSQEERITALEKQNAELIAQLEAYEVSYAKGVQEA